MAQFHANIIHRADSAARVQPVFDYQWRAARERGLVSTTLVTLPALLDERLCESIRARWEGSRDELGLHCHEMKGPALTERHGTRETALWLMPRTTRAAVLDDMVDLFVRRFGRPPAAVGSYLLDAWTLAYLERRHPSVRVAITNCFEEGVKMFRGNNQNWHLFSDGGPWGPFWPSRDTALKPAGDVAEAIDIVALPHLNRDMILALASRDDLFASHPLNLFRAKINEGADSPYLWRFLQQWEDQAVLNGWSYLSLFVSSPWLTPGHWAVPDMAHGRRLYEKTLDWLVEHQTAGRVRVDTMSGFGATFRAQVAPGDAQICQWRDELRQAKRETIWVVNSHYRAALDFNVGGAITDLRAYDGRVDGNMGPECPRLANGNYPYLAAAELRGGAYQNGHHAELACGDARVSLLNRRGHATVRNVAPRDAAAAGAWEIDGGEVTWELGGQRVVLRTRWRVDASGDIRVERTLEPAADPSLDWRLTEVFVGSWGTWDLPEDLRGITLGAWDAAGGELARIVSAYASQSATVAGAARVSVAVPPIGVTLSLVADPAGPVPTAGHLAEGTLFAPVYRLSLTHRLTPGIPVITWLKLAPLTP
jgi:hypothetical protein